MKKMKRVALVTALITALVVPSFAASPKMETKKDDTTTTQGKKHKKHPTETPKPAEEKK
jgi:hypothetical protein